MNQRQWDIHRNSYIFIKESAFENVVWELWDILSQPQCVHMVHRPGKVMEFNPWLEKSLNFMLTWKNGILPGKVIENQRKSLKNFMYHVKVNLNMKTLMIIWLKVSFCHYIWDQIGETMLSDCLAELLVTLLQIAEPLVTLYELNPIKQYLQGKHQGSKLPAIVSDRVGVNSGVGVGVGFNSNSNSGVGVGIRVETSGFGVGVGVDIQETCRSWSWSWNSWSWSWSWKFKRLAGVGVGVETPGVGVGIGVETLGSWNWSWNFVKYFLYIHIFKHYLKHITLKLCPSYYAY